jgi:hypothetical protein
MSPDYFRLGAALDQQVNNPFFGVIPSGTLAGRTVPQHRLLRPHPQFVSVDMTGDTPGASSSFNAMFLKFSKQFSQGLSVMASYQFSKALDNASENQGWIHSESFRNVYDFSSDRSISAHDVPQSFVSAVIYDIPVGKGRKFAAAMPAVADAVLGGWQISTIVRLSSGLPCQLTAPNTLATYGFSIHRPSIASLRDLDVAERTPEMWFNTAAAKAPAPYTIGNAPRYMPNLRRGGMQHADLAILKNFQFFESVRAQLRGEFFNLTNSPQFGMPGSQVGASNFGQVTGTQFIGPRNVQLGLKVYF